jgi:hypothetical protein
VCSSDLASESVQRAEDAEKDLLGHVKSFFPIAKQVGSQSEDQAVVLKDESGVGCFIAGKAALD